MATPAVCNSFKNELLAMAPHTAADVYKIALYTSASTIDKTTTAYTVTNEASGTGYAAGGIALAGFTVALYTDTAVLDWTTDPAWPSSSITARYALIYNSTRANKSVAVIDLGADTTSTAGTFTVVLPVPAAATGIVRFA